MSEKDYKGGGALDAFLNLLSLITLGWVSISVGGVLFQIIDKFFNPALSGSLTQFSQSSLKASVAATIIVTPIFLMVASYLHKHYQEGKLNPNSGVYRWLTYLMLLIASLNIIGSLIMIIYRLLDGVYTTSSILKILVVLIIAGAIFGYYWYDLKRKDYSKRSPVSVAAFTAIIVIAIFAVITSFFIVDSPGSARMKKFDGQRVNDLSTINSLIMSHYMQNDKLPDDINDVRFSAIVDPETKQKIEELRALESQLQNWLAQKQNSEIELNEIENALTEVEKSEGDMYKVVAGIMIKSDKEILIKELGEKKRIADMRIDSIEKQEKILEKSVGELKKEIDSKIKP